MRVLWIKMGGLWPLNTGGRQRTFQLVSALSASHDVTVVTTHDHDDDPDGLTRALEGGHVVSLPYHASKYGGAGFARALLRSWASRYPVGMQKWRVPAVAALVRDRLARESYDVIVADFVFAMPQVPRRLDVPLVFFSHNVEYMIWRRLRDVERRRVRRGLLGVEWRKMRRAELDAIGRADVTVAVSDRDRSTFAASRPGAEFAVISTGVDTTYFSPRLGLEVPKRLVFSGSMDWYPNEDAILYFLRDIWPHVRRVHPDASLTVVGRNPSQTLKDAARLAENVLVTGTVDDVRHHVAEGAVYIVPLRIGGGTRMKIFEALAMGKATVSTTIGAEGLALESNRHVVLADGSLAFASAVLQLLAEPERRAALGREGRQLVAERYAWPVVAREFERAIDQAVHNHAGRAPAARRPPTETAVKSLSS